jgi:[ribosomal protein S5]-alanine N-acetyltransferase
MSRRTRLNKRETNEQDSGNTPVESLGRAPSELASIWSWVQTTRLTLRRLQPTDGPAMFAVHGDPATYRYSPAQPHPDLATSEEMLRSCLHDWDAYGFGYWAVTLARDEEKIIGFGGVEYRVWSEREVLNLYYRLIPSTWRQGYATELASTAVSLARTYLPHWPVVARTRAENIPSIRTAERAGLIRRPDLDAEQVVVALGW